MADLSHAGLATLAREYLMAGHLIDRAGMPHAIARFDREGMTQIAVEEWMGASPIYTRRTQQLLGFARDDVAAIFQGMQLDIGAPPEFMDFRYSVDRLDAGSFHLDHCGALLDVEPMGEDFVVAMCHHIEDPTFDATAVATNPRARVRPIHRPPRTPTDRHPHCAWTVRIDADADALTLPSSVTEPMLATRAAQLPITPLGASSGDGWDRYPELDPDLRMEDFAGSTLCAILDEVALQGHLLVLSFAQAVARRAGPDAAVELVAHQLVGVAGVVSQRLALAFELPGDLDGIARAFELHPALSPASYVERSVDRDGDRVRLALAPCAAADEPAPGGWISTLIGGHADDAIGAIAHGVCDRAAARPVGTESGELAAWEIRVAGEAIDEHPDVTMTRFSTGAGFRFVRTGRRHQ